MSNKEERELRRQQKEKRRKDKSIKLAQTFVEENLSLKPRVQTLPDIEKQPRTDAHFGSLDVPKQVKSIQDGSRFGYLMTWCARLADCKDRWAWGEERQWSHDEWHSDIISGLNHLENLDWKEIQYMGSGSGHLMHHDQGVTSLCDEAVERWVNLGYEQFDTTFRFRLGSTKRAWGIELQGHFYLIWYERLHNIYPT